MTNMLNIQDQYKFPMGQLIHEQEPAANVTFKMQNRKKDMRIADYVHPEELQEYYDSLRDIRFTPEELASLETQTDKNYSKEFLGYLATFRLPEITVGIDPNNNDLTATTTAPWNEASLWEIPMLSAIPELYYPKYIAAQGGSMEQVWDQGDKRLSHMINIMQQNPNLKFAEFGTRRRFSSDWQNYAVERFVSECSDNLIGTSNPWLAVQHGIAASGTNAHELPMVYAALQEALGGNPLDGQKRVINDWLTRFPAMPVTLIDTFTSDVTLHDLTPEQYEQVQSFRIDSGNEYAVGQKVINALAKRAIDPTTKTLFFSNSLTPEKAANLAAAFNGKIGTAFGIGGNAVNNMGLDDHHNLPSLNIVAKAVSVNGHGTVKLSDDAGKHMGNPKDVSRYKQYAFERLNSASLEAA